MKLLASDLDGTLFFKELEKGYKQGDIDAIKQFQKEGHLFGCCTGRALEGATPSFKDLLDCDFYIASSGAVICDRNLNIIYDCPISFDIIQSLCHRYQHQVTVFVQTLRYHILAKGWPEEVFHYIETIDELKNKKIYGICLISEDENLLDEIEKELKENYPDVVGYRNMDAIDVVAKECSKGKAVMKVKELFQADISYGIGDSYNDIPLLQKADIGMTFPNSPKEVKKEAQWIVDSIEEALSMM